MRKLILSRDMWPKVRELLDLPENPAIKRFSLSMVDYELPTVTLEVFPNGKAVEGVVDLLRTYIMMEELKND